MPLPAAKSLDTEDASATGQRVNISIVVPCRNEHAHISRFLDGLLREQDISEAFEVLVADGQSDDGTREVIAEMATADTRLRIVDNPRRTVSFGLNNAVRQAQGEIILRMDVHTDYASDYVSKCVAVLRRTSASNVGGPARTRANGFMQEANAAAYRSWFCVGGARFHNERYSGDVDTVPYGCWLRKTLLDAGLFDEELVRNQDDELNLRLVLRGGRIYQSADICSWYYPRASLASLFRQYRQYGYWKVRVIQKHRAVASWRQLVPSFALIAGIGLSVAAFLHPVALAIAIAGLCTYVGASALASFLAVKPLSQWRLMPVLPAVFACYHFGYALGFTHGMLDFLIMGKRTAADTTALTR